MSALKPCLSHMNADAFRRRAHGHLRNLCAGFACGLLGWLIGFGVADWASERPGWESTTVGLVFGGFGALGGFSTLYFGYSIYAWVAGYHAARRDAHMYAEEPEVYIALHREVVGPIAWR